jgi:large repetitive protein
MKGPRTGSIVVVSLLTLLAALAFSPSAFAACPCSLFAPITEPALTGNATKDGRQGDGPFTLELGVKVTVDAPMTISALRFYKDALETGAHQGRVWTANGILLAQTTFQNETASGWQEQALANPLALQPGTVYVISYNANTTYVATQQALAASVVSGPLRTVADGMNGPFAGEAGTFPSQAFQNTNYFVDLVVVPSDPPPVVTAFTPASSAANVSVSTKLTATFSTKMSPATITPSSFTLRRPDGTTVPATVAYDATAKRAMLTPTVALALGTTYTARLEPTISALDTQPIPAAVESTFGTEPSIRINVGGGTTSGFAADDRFTGGQRYLSSNAILGTTTPALYQDERFGQFTYAIPVANGSYDVRLHFVELYYGSVVAGSCVGKRLFGMDVLDTTAAPDLSGLDICAEVGPNTPLVKTIPGVAVADGVLEIQSVLGALDDPELAALEILPAGTPPGVVTATTPKDRDAGVSTHATVKAAFGQRMDAATITGASFTVTAADGTPVPGTVAYSAATLAVTFTPSSALATETSYTARLSSAIRTADGAAIPATSWTFTTAGEVRINVGGAAYAAVNGAQFSADKFSTGGLVQSSTAAVSGTADGPLYQNERWGAFSYAIPVADGTYDVRLHFVELFYTGACAGKRVFGMDILDTAGTDIPATLDVCAEVGPKAALVKTITGVRVADGTLDLQSVYGSADDPELAAIEIVASGDPLPPPPAPAPMVTGRTPADLADGIAASTSVTATFSRGMSDASISTSSFTLAPTAGAPVAATVTYNGTTNVATLKPTAPLALGRTYTARLETTIQAADGAQLAAPVTWSFTIAGATRINAGGPAFTTAAGPVFTLDQRFSGGQTFSAAVPIAGTSDDALYQDERWGQFSYAVPVANGRYEVRLHFVELFYTGACAGKRLFGVDILDTTGVDLPNTFDICAQVGPTAALVKTLQATVADGVLNVKSVYGAKDDPELAAIEVIPAS